MAANNTHGPHFGWYELHTPNAAQAAEFYGKLLGWTTQDGGNPVTPYTLVKVGEMPVGGLLEKDHTTPAGKGKAAWIGYVSVGDIAASVEWLREDGGTVHKETTEIPGVGKFAVVADPQGAIFVLFQPKAGTGAPVALPDGTPGIFSWHDLAADNWQTDFEFYAKHFGWTKSRAIDMGPQFGTYQIFQANGKDVGGMMTRPDKNMPVGWLFYVNVDDIDAAVERAKAAGGTITHSPSEVPGGQWIAHVVDPQGAMLGIVGPPKKRDDSDCANK